MRFKKNRWLSAKIWRKEKIYKSKQNRRKKKRFQKNQTIKNLILFLIAAKKYINH
jgi:hypothetical protein